MMKLLRVLAALPIVLACGLAHAAPEPAAVERAKDLFKRGVALFSAKDFERALELFTQSRSVVASVQNTSNVAICLDKLGRYDEALEVYEQLLTEFQDQLGAGERQSLAPAMEALRARVGSLWVSADVTGAQVVVDGRARAVLPLVVPIRVLPGARVLRVMKDGYVTYEARINAAAATRTDAEVHLSPLANAGLLRIEDRVAGTQLFVDGLAVGATPWEGTLGPGRHVIWTQRGDVGTAPKDVVVVQGQKAVVGVEAIPLGAEVVAETEPPTAALAVDGVEVGRGTWRGRLPLGTHRLVASEAGYRERALSLDTTAAPSPHAKLALEVDPTHPRWPRSAPGQAFVELTGGYVLAPTLASDASTHCSACPSTAFAHGGVAALRGGYRFPIGVSLELMGGYVRAQSTFSRTLAATNPPTAHPDLAYELTDRLVVEGPFGAFGVGYQRALGGRFALRSRAMVGAAMTSASDGLGATMTSGDARLGVTIEDAKPVSTGAALLVEGDVGGTMRLGDWELGLSVSALGLLVDGPKLDGRTVGVSYDPACMAGSLACAPSGAPLPDERAHGRAVAFSPLVSIGRSF